LPPKFARFHLFSVPAADTLPAAVIRIAIDARSVMDQRSGIGNTVDALVRHMVPMAQDMEFVLLRHPGARRPIIAHPRVRELHCAGETKSVHTVFSVGRKLRDVAFDCYHACADLVPLGMSLPWVVTIHDLMWVEAPKLASAFWPQRLANAIWYRANIGRAVRGARRIVAVSEATRAAIERVYPQHAHKVRVVKHGIELARYRACKGGPRSLLDPYLPADATFSLIVGQGSPYKNHAAMVRAFIDAVGDRADHKLVLVRRFARIDADMQRLLRTPEAERVVVPLPHVTDEVLFTLYRHARMLLFASHYEGFGLPALEAMAFGLPVLASTAPAVVEVTDNAALHADPLSHGDLVDKIRTLDRDEGLRERLIGAGERRVQMFSWEQAARTMLDVYREAADS
jgi:glycosyltransferase involved in cell wall biosynthesis